MFFFAFLNFSFFCRLLSHNFKFKLSAMQMNCQLMTLLIKRDLITIHHHHHQNGFSTLYIMYYNASAWMYTVVHLFINSIISNTCIFIAHWYTWYMIVCVCNLRRWQALPEIHYHHEKKRAGNNNNKNHSSNKRTK